MVRWWLRWWCPLPKGVSREEGCCWLLLLLVLTTGVLSRMEGPVKLGRWWDTAGWGGGNPPPPPHPLGESGGSGAAPRVLSVRGDAVTRASPTWPEEPCGPRAGGWPDSLLWREDCVVVEHARHSWPRLMLPDRPKPLLRVLNRPPDSPTCRVCVCVSE